MPNQNDSPPVLSGTAPTQPDYILCKDMIDLQITNISGYNGLCVNFITNGVATPFNTEYIITLNNKRVRVR
jgi:hypothetical protein